MVAATAGHAPTAPAAVEQAVEDATGATDATQASGAAGDTGEHAQTHAETAEQAAPTAVLPAWEEPPGEPESEAQHGEPDREWMGITSFITAVLLLSPVAIVLGHLGMSAAKRGRARHRSFAVAGAVLGYVGLLVWAGAAYLLATDAGGAQSVDVQAQQDVSAVGAAAATQAAETGLMPEVAQVGDDYEVAGETITAHLVGEHTLEITGSTAYDWCLSIGYTGGEQAAYSYTATGGMVAGPCSG